MGERDESDRTAFGLKRDHRTIENRPGGTHPGAEQGAMRGSLMMGMVPGVLDRLSLRQSAYGKGTKYQKDGDVFEGDSFHQKTTRYQSAANPNGCPRGLSITASRTVPLLLIGLLMLPPLNSLSHFT